MNAYDTLSDENKKKVDSLLAETKANDGLAPVDLEQFWQDQAIASKDPFGRTFHNAHLAHQRPGNVCLTSWALSRTGGASITIRSGRLI
jgi:hypothetical protein